MSFDRLRPPGDGYVRVGDHLVIKESEIRVIDCTDLDRFRVTVTLGSGMTLELLDQQALDLVMAIKPSAVEGKRFRFARHAWAFHNLVAHPALQVLAWLGYARLGFRIHDATVPRPRL